MEQPLYVGIDFGNLYSQVSYYNYTDKEPVSVDFSGLENRYQIPTILSKTHSKEQWFFGDEARNCAELGEAVLVENLIDKAYSREPVVVDDCTMMPVELIRIFFDSLLQSVVLASGMSQIAKVCITVEKFHIGILNIITEAFHMLGISKDNLILASHEESYIYYAMSQNRELWTNDVVLFDFDERGLKYYRLYSIMENGNRIVMTHEENLDEDVPYVLMGNTSSEDLLDDRLLKVAMRVMERRNVSTVYLTGKGFEGDLHIPKFIKFICERRRVFAGQNMYTKGACYQAVESDMENSIFREMVLACPQRITTGVEIKIQSRGKDRILRLIRPGVNWYGADIDADFILDEVNELELFLSPLDSHEKQVFRISLEDFPKRPKKSTRITLRLSFTSDSRCHVMVIDRGFGEFYPSSGHVINEEILL